MSETNLAYYSRRLEATQRLATEASDPGIRAIHLKMASRYECILSGELDVSLQIVRSASDFI